jgi:GNAT superfamily N-acetyltransferase
MLGRLIALLARLLGRRAGIFLARVVAYPLDVAAQARGAIRCRVASEAELRACCADPELELSEEQLRAAFARGDSCIAAYNGKRLVGYEWLALANAPHVGGLWVEFAASDGYMYKKYVRPAYRGRGIAALLIAQSAAVAAGKRRKRVVSFIHLANTAGWQAAKRSGGRTIGYVGYLAWWGRSISFRTVGARRHGFRLYQPSFDAVAARQKTAMP